MKVVCKDPIDSKKIKSKLSSMNISSIYASNKAEEQFIIDEQPDIDLKALLFSLGLTNTFISTPNGAMMKV